MNKIDYPILDKMFEENSKKIEQHIYEKNKRLRRIVGKIVDELVWIISNLKETQ